MSDGGHLRAAEANASLRVLGCLQESLLFGRGGSLPEIGTLHIKIKDMVPSKRYGSMDLLLELLLELVLELLQVFIA